MQARTIVDGVEFLVDGKRTPQPVGHLMDDPHCWIHCVPGYMNAPPIAEPVDDECRARVARWMETRSAKLDGLRAMVRNKDNATPAQAKQLEKLAEAYDIETEGSDD